jgi:hypothetical protein
MKDRHDNKGILPHLYAVGKFAWFNIRNIGLRQDPRRHKLEDPSNRVGSIQLRVALERNVNPTRLASRLRIFDPEISGCSPGSWGSPLCLRQFHQLHTEALMKSWLLLPH